ncbi:hypothetical protein [Stenotrophomonas sp. BIGb0135]|uniref:hypothetical protein n=1 Tax=Stenotrophomonas sp. BIGb0135 TaxID=2940620 RepID=UPI0021685D88|nr:hypothetical protein [Stenotrophomonas sp. BIGb0135]
MIYQGRAFAATCCADDLRISIKKALSIGLLLAGIGLASADASALDTTDTQGPPTTNLPPVDAVPDPPPPEFEVTPPPPDYTPPPPPDPKPPDLDGGEDGGGPGGNPDTEQICRTLMATRPQSCPNPIPFPSGPEYGEDQYPGASLRSKSTMRMALAFSRDTVSYEGSAIQVSEGARWFMEGALRDQTDNFAKGMSLKDANRNFRIGLDLACNAQMNASNAYRLHGTLTGPERYCFEIMRSFDQESNDEQSFIDWFISQAKLYGLPIGDYIPPAILDSADVQNSIGAKWRVTTEDAGCSQWWRAIHQNTCGVP